MWDRWADHHQCFGMLPANLEVLIRQTLYGSTLEIRLQLTINKPMDTRSTASRWAAEHDRAGHSPRPGHRPLTKFSLVNKQCPALISVSSSMSELDVLSGPGPSAPQRKVTQWHAGCLPHAVCSVLVVPHRHSEPQQGMGSRFHTSKSPRKRTLQTPVTQHTQGEAIKHGLSIKLLQQSQATDVGHRDLPGCGVDSS